MLKQLVNKVRTAAGLPPGETANWKLDFQGPATSAEAAAEMLRAPTAFMQLSSEEAATIVRHMEPRIIPANTVIFREGDTEQTGYMLLVIDGEVTVETQIASRQTPDTLVVLGPGSIVGEMSLFDGAPRSATCTATSEVRCAVLTREALERLARSEPTTAARLLVAVAQRLAERLRQSDEKIRLYSRLVRTMQQEINVLMR